MSRKTQTQAAPAPPAPAGPDWRANAAVAARLLVGGLLLFSGLHKAGAPVEEFMAVLEGYAVIPDPHLRLFAWVMPWAEILGGLFLAAGLWTRPAAVVTAGLSASFFLALLSTKLRGIELLNCGCFGEGIHLERWQAMTLDTILLAGSGLAWSWGGKRLALDRWVEEGR
ncbi:MAG: DoxX family membrane protein [Elusimicrobia bacterium]|nr:DoxX family membrane protein [Elusimicrobiota bacterium]